MLKNSSQEQDLLRAIALWTLDYADMALAVFEERHAEDPRPRQAIEACREFANGKKRDKNLRMVAMAALRAGKDIDEPSKHAAHAAMLTAAVAYTHTDLQTGQQGIRQAKHVLGPIVFTALALETAASDDTTVGDDIITRAIQKAPHEVRRLLASMPPQQKKSDRASTMFFNLDSGLRNS